MEAEGAQPLVVLIIMDGWGLEENTEGNAIFLADTPHIDQLYRRFPTARLEASGEDVGLPKNQMGNSEVGHLNLGAGRIVYQELVRISKAIEDGSFFQNEALRQAMEHVARHNSSLHLMGLLSDGGVHSLDEHLHALLELAAASGLSRVYVHAVLDGRDTPPVSARQYLQELEEKMEQQGVGAIASISGRYYSMDRDKRWDRTEKAYRAYVYGEGYRAASSLQALEMAYAREENDEFVLPTLVTGPGREPLARVEDKDAIIFFNFRSDRARQISRAFVDHSFDAFSRGADPPFPYFVCLTEYDPSLNLPVAFPPAYLLETLGEVVSTEGLAQLRIAETEKYAHVTYFFSGGKEEVFPGEKRILIPSPQVATYDLKPEMSAPELTAEAIKQLESDQFQLLVINYANADMVGHTGQLDAAVQAAEAVDRGVGQLTELILEKGGIAIVTADHGNAEKMQAPDGSPHTAHTNSPVPFILAARDTGYTLVSAGKLADVAPTILQLMNLPVPEAMTGDSLLIENRNSKISGQTTAAGKRGDEEQ